MKPQHKVYYFRIALASLVGLASGIIRLSPLEGLSLFLLAYFLVTPLSLRLWGQELRNTGLMKLYREALGSSFLALLLTWTLVMNLVGSGVPVYVVRASQSGIYPIQTVDGRVAGPEDRLLAGYNAVLLNISNRGIEDIYVGSYAKAAGVTEIELGNTKVRISRSNDEILLRGEYDLSNGIDSMRMRNLLGNITIFLNGTLIFNVSHRLNPGESEVIKSGSSVIKVSYKAPRILAVEINSTKGNLSAYPVSVFIRSIQEEGGFIFVFDSIRPVWRTRTARVDDSYLVVLPSG